MKTNAPLSIAALLFVVSVPALCQTNAAPISSKPPSDFAIDVAKYAKSTYSDAAVETLAELVSFPTVNEEGKPNAQLPAVQAMSKALRARAEKLGLDFRDDGAVVVIGLGKGKERLGIVAHGDVQPADPSKWKQSPFSLDSTSKPGLLIGRGTQDDKGPIAAALYAMKAIADRKVPLAKRIELIVSYTEESDWQPFQDWLAKHKPPQTNVVVDADYPVVIAEKGWCSIHLTIPKVDVPTPERPYIRSFAGGSFLSQVPEDATAVIELADEDFQGRLQDRANRFPAVHFSFDLKAETHQLTIRAKGISAHASTPEAGKNAIAHLAALLATHPWPDTQAARMVKLLDELVGVGLFGEKFGGLSYSHPFMGKLTLVVATLDAKDGSLTAGINFRRPAGRTAAEVKKSAEDAVAGWNTKHPGVNVTAATDVYDPYLAADAPQVPTLLGVYEHYTRKRDVQPISIGGGTHARLLPRGVSFGPSMPGEVYTGHSEHEFISRERLVGDLEMYTAAMVELAAKAQPKK